MRSIPTTVTINQCDFKIVVELINKKSSSARVNGDNIHLRLSSRLPKKIQHEHAQKLIESLSQKLIKKNFKPKPLLIDLTSPITVRNTQYQVFVGYASRKTLGIKSEKLPDGTIILSLTFPYDLDKETVKKHVKREFLNTLIAENTPFLLERVAHFNDRYFKLKPFSKVEFRIFKTKWGLCRSDRVVRFNILLLFCPDEILDYIIVHELSHMLEMNHSKAYWDIVDTLMPTRKIFERWLNNNGTNILNAEVVF